MDYLQPGEKVLFDAPRHPRSILDGLIALVVLWLVTMAAIGYVAGYVVAAPWLVAPAVAVTLLVAWGALLLHWRRRTSRYVITPERVYASWGRIRYNVVQTTYDKLTDLQVRQSLWGRLYGFGTVTLQTAGAGLHIAGVPDPFAWKQQVEAARTQFRNDVLGDTGDAGDAGDRMATARGAGAASAAQPSDDTIAHPANTGGRLAGDALWQRGPSQPWFVVNGLVPLALLPILVIVAAGLAVRSPEPGLLLPLLIPVVMMAVVASRHFIAYRCTRYHVHAGGVVVTSGWIGRRRVETTYPKVTDVTVSQDVLGRLFGYGRIVINTAGSNEAPVAFVGIADPDAVKAVIDDARGAA